MKKIFLLIMTGLMMVFACKKDEHNFSSPDSCINTKFQTQIPDQMIPTSICEDNDNNIIVLGNKIGEISLIKVDTSGSVLWNKAFSNIPGKASEVISLIDNSIIISSFTEDVKEPKSDVINLDNIWIQNGYNLKLYCGPTYEYGSSDGYTVKSETYLTKLDENGNIVWTNKYDESLGKGFSLSKNRQENIILLTMKLKGRDPVMVYDNYGVFQDTANYPMDDNKIVVYNIDKEGNTVFRKEINNVFNNEYDKVATKIDLHENYKYIVVKTQQELIYLSLSGDLVKTQTIKQDQCNNINECLVGSENSMIFSGSFITADTIIMNYDYNNYILQLSESGKTNWEIESDDILLDSYNDRFLTLSRDSSDLYLYNDNGLLMGSLANFASKVSIINCNKGITSAKNVNNQLVISRTNEFGEFE